METIVKTFDELSVDELYEILKLRIDVFVVEQNCPYREADGADKQAYHVFLTDGGEIHAYLRVIPKGIVSDEVMIGRVVTRERKCGLGAKILAAGIEIAVEKLGAKTIGLEAQVYARPFYEKSGFVQTTDEFLLDGISHIGMRLNISG